MKYEDKNTAVAYTGVKAVVSGYVNGGNSYFLE
jgi:hypothetical protein